MKTPYFEHSAEAITTPADFKAGDGVAALQDAKRRRKWAAWEKQKEVERDTAFVELGRLPVRGAGGTVLAGGEREVVR
jgi:hypothetical protein